MPGDEIPGGKIRGKEIPGGEIPGEIPNKPGQMRGNQLAVLMTP